MTLTKTNKHIETAIWLFRSTKMPEAERPFIPYRDEPRHYPASLSSVIMGEDNLDLEGTVALGSLMTRKANNICVFCFP